MDNSEKIQDYAILSRLSTQKLEEILRNDLASPESDSGDMAHYIMEVIEKREKMVPESEVETERAWQEFQQLYNTADGIGRSLCPIKEKIDNNEKVLQNAPPKRYRLRRTVLIAAIIAIVFVFLVPSAFGYEGLREMIGQWTDAVFRFHETDTSNTKQQEIPFEEPSSENNSSYSNIRMALADYAIPNTLIPEQVPDGFILQSVDVFERPEWGQTELQVYFQKEEKSLTFSFICCEEPVSSNYEKDSSVVEEYVSNGMTYYFFDNIDQKVVAWYDDCFECSIYGDISVDDLKNIVDSIKKE